MFAVAMVTCGRFHPFGHGDPNIPQFSADWQDAWPGVCVGVGGGLIHANSPGHLKSQGKVRLHAFMLS